MKNLESITYLLRSLVDLTRKVKASLEADELEVASRQLDERGKLLEAQVQLMAGWKELSNENDALAELRPLTDLLKQLDRELTTLFAGKKDQVAEKMRQAQNQKRLLAYLR
jgi:hypothetical protein